MALEVQVTPQDSGFGATLTGINLAALDAQQIKHIRDLWLRYQVLAFPQQPLSHGQLETFARHFGPFGDDPYVRAVAGFDHVIEVRREANETVAPFGSSWHSDWSFQATPPSATVLHGKVIPPVGGDTLFADGKAAFAALPASVQAQLRTLTAVHSARRPYSPDGFRAGGGHARSMNIVPSESAMATQEHPLVRTHPETGEEALWVNPVYTVGIKELGSDDAARLLLELTTHATQKQFLYRQVWQPQMLVMWDNRSVQHNAQGGYDGHQRIMHRVTVSGDRPR